MRTWTLGPVARGLAGPFADELAAVLGGREGESAFLLASWTRQHALLAALDAEARPGLAVLRNVLRAGGPKDLIAGAYGVSPDGLMPIFHRLARDRPPARGAYADLVRLLSEGGQGAKLLQYHPVPDFHMIDFLARLPDWARQTKAMNMDEAALGALVRLGEALRARGRITAGTLSRLLRGRPAERHPVALLASVGLDLRLPASPIAGTALLRPVRTTRQFLALADLFRNCLELRLTDALTGASAYYAWLGPQPLIVELRLIDGLWWRFGEANGYRNLAPLPDTEAQLTVDLQLEALNRRRLAEIIA